MGVEIMIGAALVGAGASYYGSRKSASAQKRALREQQEAHARNAMQERINHQVNVDRFLEAADPARLGGKIDEAAGKISGDMEGIARNVGEAFKTTGGGGATARRDADAEIRGGTKRGRGIAEIAGMSRGLNSLFEDAGVSTLPGRLDDYALQRQRESDHFANETRMQRAMASGSEWRLAGQALGAVSAGAGSYYMNRPAS